MTLAGILELGFIAMLVVAALFSGATGTTRLADGDTKAADRWENVSKGLLWATAGAIALFLYQRALGL